MKYIISEEELKELKRKVYYADDWNGLPSEIIDEFFQDKKPVTKIAEGKLFNDLNKRLWIGTPTSGYQVEGLIKKKLGKNVKIWLEVNDERNT